MSSCLHVNKTRVMTFPMAIEMRLLPCFVVYNEDGSEKNCKAVSDLARNKPKFASKILESFGYVSVTYLSLICFEILASFEYGSVVCCSRNYFRVLMENLLSYDYVISWQVKCIKSAN